METGLSRFVHYGKPDFIGREAALADRAAPPTKKLVTLVVDANDAEVSGYESILKDGKAVGQVTSGGYAHWAGKSVAMGYVQADLANDGENFVIGSSATIGPRDPGAPLFDPDGSSNADLRRGEQRMAEIFKDVRKKAYLNAEGADKPLSSPLPHATLKTARAWRKRRLVEKVHEHDCAAILLYDPINIRYALDVSNMQLWRRTTRATTRWSARTATRSPSSTASRSIWPRASRPSTKCAPRPAGSTSPPAPAWPSAWRNGPTKSPQSCASAAAATCGWPSTRWSRSASMRCASAASR
jgi:hypothetical protein